MKIILASVDVGMMKYHSIYQWFDEKIVL